MTRSCSALGCAARDNGRSRERGISFHQFPVDASQRRQWIRAVNRVDPRSRRAWRPGPGAILCSRHFAEDDFESYGLRRKLRRGAVPSRFPHPESRTRWPLKVPSNSMILREERCPSGLASDSAGVAELLAKPQAPLHDEIVLLPSDLPSESHSWMQVAEYSPEMRQFACLLHLYHIKAYDYLQKTLPLPHPYSLTKQVFISTAGFSSSIFLCLQEKVERGERAYSSCALMVQDMSLQKQREWDPQTQCLMGFVDLGAGPLDADEAPLASEAIILMAVGITSPWTAPLGYFFVNNTTGHLIAQLLRQTINKLNYIGVTVLAVTSGATACGAEAARALGIRMDPERLQCTFQHPPGSAHSIAYFFDVCHALQLIRNALQCFQKIEWLSNTMQWQDVVELAALQEHRVLEPCGPKSGQSRSKESYHLKVNLAALLFSDSVADALEHLQELGLAMFQNCSGTVKFVRLMSRLCDIFHSRGPYRRGLKEPSVAGNYSKVTHLFNEAKSFVVALKDSMGRRIIKSKRKLGFLSFLLSAESLKWFYANNVCPEGTPAPCLSYAFSLDPLEMFLRTLQQVCGSSESPTCAAFRAAYHKLLSSCSLVPDLYYSGGSWEVALSRRRELTLGGVCAQYDSAHGRTGCFYCAGLLLRSRLLSNALTDLSLHTQSVTCAASWVAQELASHLQCEACLASLFQCRESRPRCGSVLYVRKLGRVSLPSASVYHIAKVSERVLNCCGTVGDDSETTHLALEQKVFRELLGGSPLFPTLTDHLCDRELCVNNHYTILIKQITQCYLTMRINHNKHPDFKNHRLKKLKGKYLFPSPWSRCQSHQTHMQS
ncbi:THAP9 transposase, partial [Turnix velox]|nr:THAP9 transposase [Turnix velox]